MIAEFFLHLLDLTAVMLKLHTVILGRPVVVNPDKNQIPFIVNFLRF